MRVSVILAFYNEAKYLSFCLASIAIQKKNYDELILVDDGSCDNWQKIIDPQLYKNAKVYVLEHKGVASARNFGASKAKGEILIFLDGDMRYEANFIQELTYPLRKGYEIASSSRKEYVFNLDNIWAKYWDEITYGNTGLRVIPEQNIRDGTFRAIIATYFFEVGGYDSHGRTDDTTVLKKLNKTAICVDLAVCYHYNPSDLIEVFYSARWMGRDFENLGKYSKLIVYNPIYSILRTIILVFGKRELTYLFFRLVFDLGYFCGLVDLYVRRIHSK